jgi:hypothetical protein
MESQESRPLNLSPEHLAANGADVTQVAAAIISAWKEIEAALLPIIGQRGVGALYERSLYLTQRKYPWLAVIRGDSQTDMDLTVLESALATQTSVTAAAGGEAHLQALHQLLGSLVGPSLAERLLRSTRANAFTGSAAQDSHD